MKRKIEIFGFFLVFLLASLGCGNKDGYVYRSKEVLGPKKSVGAVDKAWLARHKYDHERRLLIPMVGGTRWGAVQEYKEDGTLEYKDWWVRDIKIEDLEPAPSMTLKIPKNKSVRKITTLEGINMDNVSKPTSNELEEIPSTIEESTEFIPLVPNVEDSVNEPFPNSSVIENSPAMLEENEPFEESPFAPLPGAFPPLDLPSE